MMRAKKLESGRWNVRVFDYTDPTGKRHYKSITADTKRDAELRAAQYKKEKRIPGDQTVTACIEHYLEDRKPVLSPSTYLGYERYYKNYIKDDRIARKKVMDLTSADVQRFVNGISSGLSAKSVKNVYGLFTAAIRMDHPGLIYNVKLPKAAPPKLYTPTEEDIKRLLEYMKEHDPELYKACLLGSIGCMRRGEIAALTAADCDFMKNTIRVDKAQVLTDGREYVVKKLPKTEGSVRIVVMPDWVMDEMPRSGKLVDIETVDVITWRFGRLIKAAGLPHFRFHDLRHFGASICHALGMSDAGIQARGGWTGSSMMRRVYIDTIGEILDEDTQRLMERFERLR